MEKINKKKIGSKPKYVENQFKSVFFKTLI